MTKDVIALAESAPDVRAVVAGMAAAGMDLRAHEFGDGGIIQLCDEEGRLLLSIEVPVLVEVPGEVQRLLGPEVGDVRPPVWWVEIRAAETRDGSETLALRFAVELTNRLGGVVWAGDGAYVDRARQDEGSA